MDTGVAQTQEVKLQLSVIKLNFQLISTDLGKVLWEDTWTDNVSSSSKSGYKFDSSDAYMIVFGQVIETGFVASGSVTKHITSTESEFSFSSPVSGTSGETSYSGTLTYVFTKQTASTMKLTGSSTTSYASITETTYTKDTSL